MHSIAGVTRSLKHEDYATYMYIRALGLMTSHTIRHTSGPVVYKQLHPLMVPGSYERGLKSQSAEQYHKRIRHLILREFPPILNM